MSGGGPFQDAWYSMHGNRLISCDSMRTNSEVLALISRLFGLQLIAVV